MPGLAIEYRKSPSKGGVWFVRKYQSGNPSSLTSITGLVPPMTPTKLTAPVFSPMSKL